MTITVERNDAAPGDPAILAKEMEVTVPAGGATTVALPTREVDCSAAPNDVTAPGTCLSSRAFRATASLPVTITQQNTLVDAHSADSSLLLPVSALGLTYRAVAAAPAHPEPAVFPGVGTIVDRSFVTVVGTEAGTTVEVTPSFRVKGNGTIPATPAGGKITATLGPFDVLNLESDDAISSDPEPRADLTGTIVTASARVAVFGGAETALSPILPGQPLPSDGSDCCADHLEEQLLPVSSWGKTHVVPRSFPRGSSPVEADHVRFVAGASTTHVTTSLPAPFASFTLAAGETRTVWTTTDLVVESDRPILVALLLVGKQATTEDRGDPSLAIVPPVEQHTAFAALSAPAYLKGWVSLAAPAGTTVLDGASAPAGCTPTVTLAGWDFRRCPLAAGAHELTGSQPFVALVGGYGPTSSVLAAAATRVAPLSP